MCLEKHPYLYPISAKLATVRQPPHVGPTLNSTYICFSSYICIHTSHQFYIYTASILQLHTCTIWVLTPPPTAHPLTLLSFISIIYITLVRFYQQLGHWKVASTSGYHHPEDWVRHGQYRTVPTMCTNGLMLGWFTVGLHVCVLYNSW